jgi:hypothetical protein
VPGQSLSELKECFDGRDTNGGFVIMLGRKTVVWLRQIERKWERANSRRRESERLRSLVQPHLRKGKLLHTRIRHDPRSTYQEYVEITRGTPELP